MAKAKMIRERIRLDCDFELKIDDLITKVKSLKKDALALGYTDIQVECDYWEQREYYLTGERAETDKEKNERETKEAIARAKQEDYERRQLAELKKKYGS